MNTPSLNIIATGAIECWIVLPGILEVIYEDIAPAATILEISMMCKGGKSILRLFWGTPAPIQVC